MTVVPLVAFPLVAWMTLTPASAHSKAAMLAAALVVLPALLMLVSSDPVSSHEEVRSG